MKFNEIILLLEWKEDLKRGNALLHYTDIEGLIGILKSGYIDKKFYQFNHKIEYDKNGNAFSIKDGKSVELGDIDAMRNAKEKFGEIALMRPSMPPIKTKNASTNNKEIAKQIIGSHKLGRITNKNSVAECIFIYGCYKIWC